MNFTFTQPKTKKRIADYIQYLSAVETAPRFFNWNSNIVRYYHMTFQCLRDAGLLNYVKGKGFELTESGKSYLSYVNSTKKPNKQIIKLILKEAKCELKR